MSQVQFIASQNYLSNTYNSQPSISMADDNIQESDSLRSFGLTIPADMKWKDNIQSIKG